MFTRKLAVAAFGVVAVLAPAPAFAVRPDISIPLGQTTVLDIPEGVQRVVVGDVSVADVALLPGQNRVLLINGKAAGFTNFLVFPNNGPIKSFRLEVQQDRRSETIAVRIQALELTQRKGGNVGVRWSDQVGISEAAPNSPFRFGLPVRDSLISATLNMLSQDRDIKVLANPTLVIQNGKKGTFQSGGELPIPLLQTTSGGTSYAIEWKQYGVKLEVTPHLEGENTIAMLIKPEVSTIDPENAIQLKDLSVPAISTRSVETYVQVHGGESLVIAGLLRTEKNRISSHLPFLGDVPILGYLFGGTQYDERQSELVFIVSPSVVSNNVVTPESDYGKGPLKKIP
ncbi:MAG: pilus assembly protein CpaC [Cyanobacteria bacterium RYN_339]|nr:pilus assembly protein CpaC [Cyanobacteria bacterium RYN_339]